MGLFGKSGPQGLPPRAAPLPRDIQLRLSQRGTTGVGSLSFVCSSPDRGTGETTLNSPWGHWGPPFHNMGLCGRPGGDPNAWKHFGPEPDPGRRALHTVRHREMKTGISEASKRVSIFSFATQGGKQVSFYFRQRNWVQAREAQIRFPAG